MEKKKKYEKFEVDDPMRKKQESHLSVKIGIFLVLIIIFQIIYIICINSYLKEQNDKLLQINFKKYLLEDGNKKLYEELHEDVLTKYSDDEILKQTDIDIKRKEEEIDDFIKKSNHLLNNFSPTTETFIRIKEENDKKKLKINELNLKLIDSNKELREKYNTKIIDSINELNSIQALIHKYNLNNIKLCYKGENKQINFAEAYDKCDFNKDISILIVFQTDIFERYGIYISNKKDNNSIVFSFNFKKKENKSVEINETQRQSFIYLINLVKEAISNNNNNDNKNNMKELNVVDLEVFHI